MSRETKIYEKYLYEIWQNQKFENPLKTVSGDTVEILDNGARDDSLGGPDFKNARIRIGNLTFVGDIEIDCNYSDWKMHGHNIDNKYNKVILHISLLNKHDQAYVYTKEGRKIPTLCLDEFVADESLEKIKEEICTAETEDAPSALRCSDANGVMSAEDKEKILIQLGEERFNKKCKRIFDRLKELRFIEEMKIKEPVLSYELTSQFHERQFTHSDFKEKNLWIQLFYELLFEALGYSKNKSQMTTLAQHANVGFLSKIEDDGVLIQKYESALYNVSGLIPPDKKTADDATRKYLEVMDIHWNSIRAYYDGKILDSEQWHFFRLRPQNFPTIRIAAGARFLKTLLHGNLINVIAKKITEIHNITVLINSMRSLFVIKSDGFWKTHFVFDQASNGEVKYFVGASRADEIVVNVVLPFFAVYFEIFGNQNIAKKVMKIYMAYNQKSDNKIITDVSESLAMTNLTNRTIVAQGMIELFRNYCSKSKCLECEIGKMVFS